MDSSYCSVSAEQKYEVKVYFIYMKIYIKKMFQYQSQVLRKYTMSEIKLPLTLEITSDAGYDTVVSNELTDS